MEKFVKHLAKLIPDLRQILSEQKLLVGQRDSLKKKCDELKKQCSRLKSIVESQGAPQFVPPGHFYSPIPLKKDVETYITKFFGQLPDSIPAVDLRSDNQLALLDEFRQYYSEIPFPKEKSPDFRFFFENPAYSYSDSIFLYCMLRHVKPKRVIEVGSGYSSCAMLDTNERFFNGNIEFTFIEPYPDLLLSLLRDSDHAKVNVIERKLQDVDVSRFKNLDNNDLVFIDSTHVSKVNSDVNYIFSQILPVLNPGVFVHFHDIFYPFEYPEPWLRQNRAWTELYMLRTFLQFNDSFKVVVFNSYLQKMYREKIESDMPLCLKNEGGSIWLQKTKPDRP